MSSCEKRNENLGKEDDNNTDMNDINTGTEEDVVLEKCPISDIGYIKYSRIDNLYSTNNIFNLYTDEELLTIKGMELINIGKIRLEGFEKLKNVETIYIDKCILSLAY